MKTTKKKTIKKHKVKTKKAVTKTAKKAVKKAKKTKKVTTKKPYDFRRLIGIGLRSPQNPNPEYMSDKDIWK